MLEKNLVLKYYGNHMEVFWASTDISIHCEDFHQFDFEHQL